MEQNLIKAAREGKRLLEENLKLKATSINQLAELQSVKLSLEKLARRNEILVTDSVDETKALTKEHLEQVKYLTLSRDQLKETVIQEKTRSLSLTTNLERAEDAAKESNAEVRRLQTEITTSSKREYKTYDSDLSSELLSKSAENDVLTQRINDMNDQIVKLAEQNVIARRERAETDANAKHLIEALAAKDDDITNLKERMEDLEFEKQTMTMTLATDVQQVDMASTGNSLFSEVEDRRRVQAQQLNSLENNYKSKIDKFDKVVEENEQLRNSLNLKESELVQCRHTDGHIDRLANEIKELRQARDEALSQVESLQNFVSFLQSSNRDPSEGESDADFYTRVKQWRNEREDELQQLHRKHKGLMLDKAGQSDRLRCQNNRLCELERKNINLESEKIELTKQLRELQSSGPLALVDAVNNISHCSPVPHRKEQNSNTFDSETFNNSKEKTEAQKELDAAPECKPQ